MHEYPQRCHQTWRTSWGIPKTWAISHLWWENRWTIHGGFPANHGADYQKVDRHVLGFGCEKRGVLGHRISPTGKWVFFQLLMATAMGFLTTKNYQPYFADLAHQGAEKCGKCSFLLDLAILFSAAVRLVAFWKLTSCTSSFTSSPGVNQDPIRSLVRSNMIWYPTPLRPPMTSHEEPPCFRTLSSRNSSFATCGVRSFDLAKGQSRRAWQDGRMAGWWNTLEHHDFFLDIMISLN